MERALSAPTRRRIYPTLGQYAVSVILRNLARTSQRRQDGPLTCCRPRQSRDVSVRRGRSRASDAYVPRTGATARAAGIRLISCGFTPREVAEAAEFGICKLFPAHVGGMEYLKTLRAILPHARIMPTGGVGVGDVASWLRAGAAAVGVGSDLTAHPDLDLAISMLRTQVAEGRGA
ncbi:hypothetical protein ACFVSU_07100 [Microbacterium sp. NPDC058062]|uniref:hypothetical protein n=1 Tax=Microbacterium sp. NPDC058062 TaxID=3346320 RepID=UPI0036D936C6